METPNYRKGSIYFDDETVLEVEQRGGGGSGVGGDLGLKARNLVTGEETGEGGGGADIAEIAITLTNNTNNTYGLIYIEDNVVNYYSHIGSYSKTINVPLHIMIEEGVEYHAAEIILAKCNGSAWSFDTDGYSETINVSSSDPDAIVVLPTSSLIIAKQSTFSSITVTVDIT